MPSPLDLEGITLKSGSHYTREAGMCVMEAIAWIAGEEHSDRPECVRPVISSFLRAWNDGLPSDADRDRVLKPLLLPVIGTRGTPAGNSRCAWMVLDWLCRDFTPVWLRSAGLTEDAGAISRLPEIRDEHSLRASVSQLKLAQRAATAAWVKMYSAGFEGAGRSAMWRVSNAAVKATAWEAATIAAWDTPWGALRDGASSIAGDVSGLSARTRPWGTMRLDASGMSHREAAAAAWEALSPTMDGLQQSAARLVLRMCDVRD